MRHVLAVTGGGLAVLLPVATVVGWLAGGRDIGLGILVGLAVPAVFFGITVLTGMLAARLDNAPFVGVVMAAWVVKMGGLLAIMAVLRDAGFFHRTAFFIAFVVGVTGWLAAEVIVLLRSRVPYVEVAPRAEAAEEAAGSDALSTGGARGV
ncbi:hypothetical protein EF847_17820 [Actinobacteria bacterium YIM 96077]|uniref:ATP synthase subunit I n=2 Tax=Phytoactinopolyspora halophila TaxID=1981511 RepID=A0A329QT67_9ACTN|nr:hypothetical protein EF847_17820 [Actinobacteria bacterium YIM 96077]RAW14819.1 hypothetical protein DPM12_10035 [Phytoactinopolyspora halophila]